ncbi:MAG TPA: hypothetical protein VGK05_08450 [Acidimicrobiia bacterium]
MLAACGGGSTGRPDPRAGGRPDVAVVRVTTRGGFAPEASRRGQLPHPSVFGDGRVIILGPTTLEFPGPALPNIQEFRLTGDGLKRIIDEARTAGLLDEPPPDYGDPGITDQPTTTVTVHAGGRTHRVEAYALGFTDGLTPEQRENRERLNRFIGLAGDPEALRDVVVPGGTHRYEPTALAVHVQPFLVDIKTEERNWPLGDLAGMECAVFRGRDLTAVLDAARNAREGVRWLSGNDSYRLVFRPLLPDEKGCDDLR